MAGLFLHGFLIILIPGPLTVSALPIIASEVEGTYLWFRNVSFLSPNLKILVRVVTIFLASLHTSRLELYYHNLHHDDGVEYVAKNDNL